MWLGVLPLCDHFDPNPGVSPLFNPFLFSPVASPAPCVLRLYGRRVKFNCLAGDVRHTNEVSLSCGSGCMVVWSKLPSHGRVRGFPLLWAMLTGRVVEVSLLYGRGCPVVLSRFPCRVAEAVRSCCRGFPVVCTRLSGRVVKVSLSCGESIRSCCRGFPVVWTRLSGRVVEATLSCGRGCPVVLSRLPGVICLGLLPI